MKPGPVFQSSTGQYSFRLPMADFFGSGMMGEGGLQTGRYGELGQVLIKTTVSWFVQSLRPCQVLQLTFRTWLLCTGLW